VSHVGAIGATESIERGNRLRGKGKAKRARSRSGLPRSVRKVVNAMRAFRDRESPALGGKITAQQLIDEERRRELAAEKARTVRPDPAEKAERDFDVEFWQKLGPEAIFDAAWDMVVTAERIKNQNADLRLRRDVVVLKRF
jgi:hypothetical protein